jgi:protocatechuate 3,4-dioxygenase beta subunit
VDGKGRPVAGAEVRAATTSQEVEPYEEARETVVSAQTSPAGTATLSGLPADRTLWILVEKEGFTPEARGVALPRGEPERKLRIPLQPGGVAVGQVVDEKGRPVAGAEVELSGDPFGVPFEDADLHPEPAIEARSHLPSILREKARFKARTGRAGRFRFRDLPKGRLDLTIHHPDHVRLWVEEPVEGGVAGRLGRYVLRRGARLTGTVTDPNGRPITGARIWKEQGLPTAGDVPPPVTVSRSDGSFQLAASTEGERLVLCAEGFLKGQAEAWPAHEPLRVTLQPAATIRGRVLGPDGSPLSGVWIVPSRAGEGPSCLPYQEPPPCPTGVAAPSDSAGRFVLGPLLPGWYTLRSDAPGLPEAVVRAIRAEAGAAVDGVEVRLPAGVAVAERAGDPDGGPPVEIQGRVLDPEGIPLEGALVALQSRRVHSSPDGSFLLRAPEEQNPTFPAEITVVKSGFARSRTIVPLAGSRVHRATIRLEKGATIAGRVLGLTGREEQPVTVSLTLPNENDNLLSARVDAAGWFRLGPVASGIWRVLAETDDVDWTVEREVTIEPGQTEARVDLEAPPVHLVSGRVLDPDGRPAAAIQLELRAGEHGSRGWQTTGADGTFSIKATDGTYRLITRDERFAEVGQPVRVDGSPVDGIELRMDRGTRLHGRFSGLAPGEVPVVHASANKASSFRNGQVDLDGGWSLPGLAPGTWAVEASLGSRRTIRRTIEIPAGVTEMEIDLDLPGPPEKAEP